MTPLSAGSLRCLRFSLSPSQLLRRHFENGSKAEMVMMIESSMKATEVGRAIQGARRVRRHACGWIAAVLHAVHVRASKTIELPVFKARSRGCQFEHGSATDPRATVECRAVKIAIAVGIQAVLVPRESRVRTIEVENYVLGIHRAGRHKFIHSAMAVRVRPNRAAFVGRAKERAVAARDQRRVWIRTVSSALKAVKDGFGITGPRRRQLEDCPATRFITGARRAPARARATAIYGRTVERTRPVCDNATPGERAIASTLKTVENRFSESGSRGSQLKDRAASAGIVRIRAGRRGATAGCGTVQRSTLI